MKSILPCPHCLLVQQCKNNEYPLLIKSFEHSFLVLGTHQYFKGYAQLISKQHIRDLHLIDQDLRLAIMNELMLSLKAIEDHYHPWKMNFSFYGNQVEHAHFHLFPRYEDGENHLKVPWFYMDAFNTKLTLPEDEQMNIKAIQLLLDKK